MSDGQYTITVDQERGFVYVVAEGEFERNLGDELITSARQEAAKRQTNILCDVRQATIRVTLADWFFLPRRLGVYKNTKTRGIETAIVVAGGKQERGFRFLETVTNNVGMNIRIFLAEEDAVAWLVENN